MGKTLRAQDAGSWDMLVPLSITNDATTAMNTHMRLALWVRALPPRAYLRRKGSE